MRNRLKLKGLGVNVVVLIVAIAVFGCSFFGLTAYGNAMKPDTVEVLTLTRDVQPGEVLAPGDVEPLEMFDDPVTREAYFFADEVDQVVGQVVLIPQSAGHPLLRGALLSPAGGRLAGLLADDPDAVLMPFPLDVNNVVAPRVDDIYPGDRVLVTAMVADRPNRVEEFPADAVPAGGVPEEGRRPVSASPVSLTEEKAGPDAGVSAALERLRPPVAKTLFPRGLEVVAVYGKTPRPRQAQEEQDDRTDLFAASAPEDPFGRRPLLVLKVPADEAERLALILGRADLIVVSLMGRPDALAGVTRGYTYDDFEAQLLEERLLALTAAVTDTQALTDTRGSSAVSSVAAGRPLTGTVPATDSSERETDRESLPQTPDWSLTAEEAALVFSLWTGENPEYAGAVEQLRSQSPALDQAAADLGRNPQKMVAVLQALQDRGYVDDEGNLNADLAACLNRWAQGDVACAVGENAETGRFDIYRLEEGP